MFAARETLRTTEQTVLLNAATAYMNLLRDAAILELQRSNVNVLEVTLRQTRDRFNAGEVTRTDVAQAESRLAAGRSQLAVAESNYVTVAGAVPAGDRRAGAGAAVARRRRSTGCRRATLGGAIARGRTEHPTITTAMYNVDVATHQVKIAEGALYPTLSAVGSVQQDLWLDPIARGARKPRTHRCRRSSRSRSTRAARNTPPSAQAKETLGQRRLDLDTARDRCSRR